MKKILIVDDSALMRRVLCDIINKDGRFEVADMAADGQEALALLRQKQYDAVVLDVNMPRMTGIQLLEELRRYGIRARVMMASTLTKDGAQTTIRALELGALDFIHKPSAVELRMDAFKSELLMTLDAVANARLPYVEGAVRTPERQRPVPEVKVTAPPSAKIRPARPAGSFKNKIVAIASSTGGPNALQAVIPKLPGRLNAPVLIVQHMPAGFTASLAERLNGLSNVSVKEAVDGEELKKGTVYIARGGLHMNVKSFPNGRSIVYYSKEPFREGVRPCANYMYESLAESSFDQVVCVVMTGMGADGTEGIRRLQDKKPVYVISQDQDSCVVYGMPKSVEEASLSDSVVPLDRIAKEIAAQVGTE